MNDSKTIITVFLLFIGTFCYSQIIDLGKCETEELSPSGFAEMKDLIGDARIVVIGEQNHGVGTDYESFAYMVKFLHEEMGFNVIAQEYCFQHFGLVNSNLKKGGSSQAYRNGMYWPQGKAKENDLLFDYIDAQINTDTPLYMEGFDPRIFQREAFYGKLDSLLNTDYSLLSNELKSSFMGTLNNLLTLEYNDTITSPSNKTVFLENINAIISHMKNGQYAPRTIQLMKNMESFAKNAWNSQGYSIDDVDRFYEREHQMANNIFWLSEVMYPNEKIIIHMHNGHAAKNIDKLKGSIPNSLIKKKPNVGTLLSDRYGKSCVNIATTYYSGTYCKWDYKVRDIPTPRFNALETKLHKKGYKYAFVDFRKNRKRKFYMFHSEFNSWVEEGVIKAPFGMLFDGLIFIDHVNFPKKKDAYNM